METTLQNRLRDIQPKLLSFAYSLTKNRDEARNLLDDTTRQVLANEQKYTANTNLSGWVLTQMRSIFMSRVASSGSVAVSDRAADCYQLNVTVEADMPKGTIATSEFAASVAKLDEEYSAPFNLYVSGYTYQEIADELDLPLATVRTRVLYAQQHIA